MVTPEAIKDLRQRRRWTTYDLAEQVGCNQSTISRIEAGGNFSRVLEKALARLIAESGRYTSVSPATEPSGFGENDGNVRP